CCITQCEAPSIWQKTAVRVGTGELAHSRLLQSLQPCGNRAKLLLQLLNGRTCHFQPGSFVGIFACALLLPAPNVLTDFGAFRSQLLQSICGPGRRVRGDARGIDGHMPQLSEPQRARQLHYLREDIVHGSPMSLAKLIQCPKIWLCASRQIAKRQIFPNALLQTPRTSDPQGVGIQPYFQQQRRMICRVSFVAVSCFKLPQIQPLHGSMHKKAKMPLSQHLSHRRWQQIRLLWVVLQKIGHPALLPSGSIDAASSPVTTQTRYPPSGFPIHQGESRRASSSMTNRSTSESSPALLPLISTEIFHDPALLCALRVLCGESFLLSPNSNHSRTHATTRAGSGGNLRDYAILSCTHTVVHEASPNHRMMPMSDTKIIAAETNKVAPETKAARPTWKPAGKVHAGDQPFTYPLKREFVEPDWRRLPGYKDVTQEEWETALWQRKHTVKNLKELKAVFGDLIPESLMTGLQRDIKERATMSILVPPHMLNTMDEKDLWNDPVRRYMLPAFEDRHPEWPSHPKASRDSLHEADMWAVEGLTHRYPTKVLAELLSTCPQYCGHCTRMDLVGNDVPQVVKLKFQVPQKDRYE